jgi:glycosyltransferase involved in cell wall biosynthesis
MREMPGIQMEADLLFLPLAFNSPYPELVRTSATTKLGEYLAARRPVLVHAPPDSFVSWYFRRYDCGLVVDESDPARLAEGIERVLGDAGLRRLLSANAWERARADFDIRQSRDAFARLIGLEGAQGR